MCILKSHLMQFALDYINQRAGKETSNQRLDVFAKYICGIHHDGWRLKWELPAETVAFAAQGM